MHSSRNSRIRTGDKSVYSRPLYQAELYSEWRDIKSRHITELKNAIKNRTIAYTQKNNSLGNAAYRIRTCVPHETALAGRRNKPLCQHGKQRTPKRAFGDIMNKKA